jgi:hypothetical protein
MRRISSGRNVLRAAAWMSIAGMVSVAAAGPRYNVAGVVRIADDGAGKLVVEGTLGEVRNSSSDAHKLMCQQSRTENLNAAGSIVRSTVVVCQARNTERSVACVSTSEAVANALSGAANDALIQLRITGNNCTDITVYESSGLIKK